MGGYHGVTGTPATCGASVEYIIAKAAKVVGGSVS